MTSPSENVVVIEHRDNQLRGDGVEVEIVEEMASLWSMATSRVMVLPINVFTKICIAPEQVLEQK